MLRAYYKIIPVIIIFSSGCSFLFFYPEKKFFDNPYITQFSFKDVYFKSSDGVQLHGWYIKSKGKKLGTILQLHGNAENISTHVNSVLWLALEGYDIFTFDYRGYGKSKGYPSIDGVHKDAMAALKTAMKLQDDNNNHFFVLGQSLGGAIAIYTVANSPYKNQIKAVIIDSAFSSYRAIAAEKIANLAIKGICQNSLALLFNDDYSPVKWIKKIYPVPVLIIHGENDRIVPPHHASAIYSEAEEPKELWLIKDTSHIQAFADVNVRKRLLEYLQNKE